MSRSRPASGQLLAGDRVGLAAGWPAAPGSTAPMMRIASPGPGNGCRQTIAGRQPELLTDRAHLVLEQGPQRLDQLELQVVGQPADVVVALDVGRALAAAGLDHVGVEGALDEPLDLARAAAARPPLRSTTSRAAASKVRMNSRPMILRLVSGSVTPARWPRNWSLRVDDLEVHVGGVHVVALDLLGLALAQQTVVDEDAGQLVADGALHQGRGDRGVDPAGEGAEHLGRRRPGRGSSRPAPRRC